MIENMKLRDRLALAVGIALNRRWAWQTLADAYAVPPAMNRAQRRALAKGRR